MIDHDTLPTFVLEEDALPEPLPHECSAYCASDHSYHVEVVYSTYAAEPLSSTDITKLRKTNGMCIFAVLPAREAPPFGDLFRMRGYDPRICKAGDSFPYPYSFLVLFTTLPGTRRMTYKEHSEYMMRKQGYFGRL